jgi:hypothetical protein
MAQKRRERKRERKESGCGAADQGESNGKAGVEYETALGAETAPDQGRDATERGFEGRSFEGRDFA